MKSIWNWLFRPERDIQEASQVAEEAKKEPELIVVEPVLSFVALVKSNPRRFKVREKWRLGSGGFIGWLILDKVTKEWFHCEKHKVSYFRIGDTIGTRYEYIGNPSILTQDEWKYIESNLGGDYNNSKAKRYRAIKSAKADRLAQEERQRLINVYCPK